MTSQSEIGPNSYHRISPSNVSEVDILCGEIRKFLESEGLNGRWFFLELALREALNNAILHGNRNQNTKSVRLDAHIGRKWIRISVADDGPGFNWRKLRRLPFPDFEATSGRGLCIMASCSDRLAHNRRGNCITLWVNKLVKDKNTAI